MILQEAAGKVAGNSSERVFLTPPVPGRPESSVCIFLEFGVQRTHFWTSFTDCSWMCMQEYPGSGYQLWMPSERWWVGSNITVYRIQPDSAKAIKISLLSPALATFWSPAMTSTNTTHFIFQKCTQGRSPASPLSDSKYPVQEEKSAKCTEEGGLTTLSSNSDIRWLWNLGSSLSPRE